MFAICLWLFGVVCYFWLGCSLVALGFRFVGFLALGLVFVWFLCVLFGGLVVCVRFGVGYACDCFRCLLVNSVVVFIFCC